jgi:membrane-bound lytic murein transglycosylase MltF
MPAIQLEIELTVEQLLQAIEQLTDDELVQFETEYPRRRLKTISEIDTMLDLHSAIAYRFPQEKQKRLDDLIDKNNAGTITEAERSELAALVEEFDQKTLEKTQAMYRLTLLENRLSLRDSDEK